MLTEEHRLKRQAIALDFLTRNSEEGDNFLSCVVTGDERWVLHTTPESKQQFMERRHTSSPKKTKFKQATSTRKIMYTVFGDRKGVLLVDLAPSDFHLFLHLISFLAGRRFRDDNEVKEAVTTCFASQAASF